MVKNLPTKKDTTIVALCSLKINTAWVRCVDFEMNQNYKSLFHKFNFYKSIKSLSPATSSTTSSTATSAVYSSVEVATLLAILSAAIAYLLPATIL